MPERERDGPTVQPSPAHCEAFGVTAARLCAGRRHVSLAQRQRDRQLRRRVDGTEQHARRRVARLLTRQKHRNCTARVRGPVRHKLSRGERKHDQRRGGLASVAQRSDLGANCMQEVVLIEFEGGAVLGLCRGGARTRDDDVESPERACSTRAMLPLGRGGRRDCWVGE